MTTLIEIAQDSQAADAGREEYHVHLTLNLRIVPAGYGDGSGARWQADSVTEVARGTYAECVAAAAALREQYPAAALGDSGERRWELYAPRNA